MSSTVIYMAHPVGGDVAANVARARRWLRFLIDLPLDVIWCCPWLPYVDVLDDSDPEHREIGMQASLALVERCDGVVLVGDRMSPGMERERNVAELHDGIVIDFTTLWPEPPTNEFVIGTMVQRIALACGRS